MIISCETTLILFAPLAAALMTFLLSGFIGQRVYKFGVIVHVMAFVVSLQILHTVSSGGPVVLNLSQFPSPSTKLFRFSLYVDRLAAIMTVIISGISALIHLYSIRFMQQERGRARFHILLSLTTFVLLCMVSSANLLILFVFWQLLSWLLSLLAYNYSDPPTVQGSFRTFTMLRFGDVVFLAGIVLAFGLYGTLDFQELFIRASLARTVFSFEPGGLEISAVTVITLLIFIGAMSKSAQFPLHGWLPDSLYAPTPVHALLHAGIINAGGFLLNRLAPLYGLSSATLHLVFGVGALTAFLGACVMLTQNDIKKTLGYSTIGQMGYMIMECGLGAFALAVFHLIAHGLFKATIFLNCGNVIHSARTEPRLPSKQETMKVTDFSRLTWVTGFVATLILPLIILLTAHGVLSLPLRHSQGIVIFLFFSWVTSSQAILTLYRLQAVASWKVAILMLMTLLMVVLTYLLAADAFTYFLYPAQGEAAFYFQAAALPAWLFDFIVGSMSLLVILGWSFFYAKSHGKSILMPAWADRLYVRSYLFFMNRLYLDNLWFRLGRGFTSMAHRLNQSRFVSYGTGLIAIGLALPAANRLRDLSSVEIALFLIVALFLPLFPLHGVYVAALTRLPGSIAKWLAILLPVFGFFGLIHLLPRLAGMPAEFFAGVRVLALFGAFYGSLRALAQSRISHLLAYTSLTFFSILWWYLSMTGKYTPQAGAYASAAVLVIGGLFLAWNRVQARYGDPDLNRIGGLANPMPRLSILLLLLVMAAVGLPPFGLFSSYMVMLFDPPFAFSMDLMIILAAWLAASWYLFRMMQQVLFGPHRSDIPYQDLRLAEAAPLLIVLAILLALGIIPYEFFGEETLANTYQTVTELTSWDK